MSSLKNLQVNTERRNQMIDITARIQKLVNDADIADGRVDVFVPHTTAAVTINENADPTVKSDILQYLEKLIPQRAGFSHSEGNSDAHIKSGLVGSSLSVFVSAGHLVLGRWQGIYFCDFDGPRSRKVIVKIVSDD
jgi:secondary thiamine-phosphate synthase enzyme